MPREEGAASAAPPASGASPVPAAMPSRLPALLLALRPHQWAKNVLLLVAPVAGHRLLEPAVLGRTVVAFAASCLAASSAYVLNDLLDVESDRRHATKRARPFASGALPMAAGWVLSPVLAAGALAAAWGLPLQFRLLLGGYFAATVVYSTHLKREPVLDVMVLAGLYTVRVFAGAAAAGVPVSEWLASFALFLFLSLAFLKRAAELAQATDRLHGRGYLPADRAAVDAMGVAAGYLSVLVLALYVTSRDVRALYGRPELLWGLCVLLLYWVSRLWLLASRGEVDEDPVLFALADRASWGVAAAGAAVVWLASGKPR